MPYDFIENKPASGSLARACTYINNMRKHYGNRLIMMDEGHIILDVSGEDKKKLTVPALIDEFRKIRRKEFDSDEGLLTT